MGDNLPILPTRLCQSSAGELFRDAAPAQFFRNKGVFDEALVSIAPVTDKGGLSTRDLEFETLPRDVVFNRWFGLQSVRRLLRLLARLVGLTRLLPIMIRVPLVHCHKANSPGHRSNRCLRSRDDFSPGVSSRPNSTGTRSKPFLTTDRLSLDADHAQLIRVGPRETVGDGDFFP